MIKNESILLLQKYQKVARLLGNEDDVKGFDEIISLCKQHGSDNAKPDQDAPKRKSDEIAFIEFTKSHGEHIGELSVHPEIKANKGRMIDFWDSLEAVQKEEFTIFELNIIRFLVSEQYDNYLKKDKKRIITSVDHAVRAKKMEKSYRDIKV